MHKKDLYKDTSKKINDIDEETKEKINKKLDELNKNIGINFELSRKAYDSLMDKYITNLENEINESFKIIEYKKKNIDASIDVEVEKRKQIIIDSLDNKIIEILNSYLKNCLEGGINIDNQEDYILDNLNQNKSLIVEEIKNA
jgi:predicted metal-dependent hydrolase